MMSTTELKRVLIHKITEMNDVTLLRAVKALIDTKAENDIFSLTPEQRNEILESKKDIERGFFVETYDLEEEIKNWAGEK